MQLAKQETATKHTEIGVIPADWEVKPLGRLVSSVEYGSAAKSDVKGAIPVLRMGNLQGGKIDWNDLVYTDDTKEIAKYTLRPGDVLFNRTNTIELVGKTSIYLGEQPAIFAGYLIRINVLRDLLDSRYLNYILNTELAKKHSSKVLSVAVGQANINGQKLKTYPIPLPPTLAEQEAIAGALSDADGLIESLDKLIAKKRQIKHGTMQELLTGHRRLPGFSGKWETKRLGKVVECSPSGTYGVERQSPLLLAMPVATTAQISNDDRWNGKAMQTRFFTTEQIATYGVIVGDLVVVKSSGSAASIQSGKMVLVDESLAGAFLFSNFLMRLRPKLVSANFLYFFLTSSRIKSMLPSLCEASTYPNIRINEYLEIAIPVPEVDEQEAIATILSDMDAEIAALDAKLAKARQVKQGMMQELLTGRTRLI